MERRFSAVRTYNAGRIHSCKQLESFLTFFSSFQSTIRHEKIPDVFVANLLVYFKVRNLRDHQHKNFGGTRITKHFVLFVTPWGACLIICELEKAAHVL